MAENSDWMERTLAGRAAMFTTVGANIGSYAGALPLTNIQVQHITDICTQFLATYNHVTQVQAAAHGVVEWRQIILNGEPKGSTAPPPPGSPAWIGPGNEFIGIIALFRDWRELIVALPGYTQAIGEALMIVKTASQGLNPSEVLPTIQVTPAQTGKLFSIVVNNREGADMWVVQIQRKNGTWEDAGTFSGKSADVTISLTDPTLPEVIMVRVQLRKNNANYGQLSLAATTTINP